MGKLTGLARGGGAELLSALDMRFAAQSTAVSRRWNANRDCVPRAGGTANLLLLWDGRAFEIVVGAAPFDAETADRYGWINRALPAAERDGFVAERGH